MLIRDLTAGVGRGPVLFTAACGGGDSGNGRSDSDAAVRRVEFTVVDIGFAPKTLNSPKTKVQFTFTNAATLRHEGTSGPSRMRRTTRRKWPRAARVRPPRRPWRRRR